MDASKIDVMSGAVDLPRQGKVADRSRRRRPLEGRLALVTGGARGIGRAIARELLRAGAFVVIGDIDQAQMEATCRDLGAEGRADWVSLDVSDHASLHDGVAAIRQRHGYIDILVNNAGIAKPGLFAQAEGRHISKALAVDLAGAICLTRTVLPHMIAARWGRVVNISSMMAFTGSPGFAVYSAAKAGLLRFGEAIERELRRAGHVRVTSVVPPSVRTSAFAQARQAEAGLMRWRWVPPIGVDAVARSTVRGLISGRKVVYCGAQSFLAAWLQRLAPWLMDKILMFMFRGSESPRLPAGREMPAVHP